MVSREDHALPVEVLSVDLDPLLDELHDEVEPPVLLDLGQNALLHAGVVRCSDLQWQDSIVVVENLGIRMPTEQVKLLGPRGTELSVADVAGILAVLFDNAILGVLLVYPSLVLGEFALLWECFVALVASDFLVGIGCIVFRLAQ